MTQKQKDKLALKFVVILILLCFVVAVYSLPKTGSSFGRDEETEKMLAWAFGEEALSVTRNKWPDLWNERHGDIFIMHGHDDVKESMQKVKEAYLKELGKL